MKPKLSIVESIFSGLSHSQARISLVAEFERRKGVHCQIIEHIQHRFVPDLNVCINGKDWWIECKVKNDELSDGQKLWLTGRLLADGNCAVISWRKDYIMLLDLTQKGDSPYFHQEFGHVSKIVDYLSIRSGLKNVSN